MQHASVEEQEVQTVDYRLRRGELPRACTEWQLEGKRIQSPEPEEIQDGTEWLTGGASIRQTSIRIGAQCVDVNS
jgi:hypothetical protein